MSKLEYKKSASRWMEALPLGNGKIAAMVYGGKKKEKIAFNDATLWSGYPKDATNSDSAKGLAEARRLIFEGQNVQADKFVMQNMKGNYSESYMPLGSISLCFKRFFGIKNYSRSLNLDDAVITVCDSTLKRESFVSFADKVFCYSIVSEEPISFKIRAESKLKSEVRTENDKMFLLGNAPDYVAPNYLITETRPIRYDEGKGMSFCLGLKVETDGKIISKNQRLCITNAKKTKIYAVTETGFNGFDKMPETDRSPVQKLCTERLNESKDYKKIKERHIVDYQTIYKRHNFSLNSENSDVVTLLERAKLGDLDDALVKLFYDYGKYMTIAASRDCQPMNLQGQWNKSIRPPWSSNLTANINFEMNYWGTSACNLAECLEPFYDSVEEIRKNGKRTAEINYAAQGFSCNHNVDIWRKTTPCQGDPEYMYAPLCGVWLANEVYAHKKNMQAKWETKTLEIIKDAALFCLDYLIEKDGVLVTCPSASPEAVFASKDGKAALDYATTYEIGLVKELFTNALTLDLPTDLKERIKISLSKLYPYKQHNNMLTEWQNGKEIIEKGHRHFSALYAFYPGRTIKYYANAEETKWVNSLFENRMENSKHSVGWSAGWAICIAARLHNKERVYQTVKGMLGKSIYTNLFDFHPPAYFQIDGNMGFVAGINEALVYEENGIIDLLPALPSQWKDGTLTGHIINGIALDMEWKNGVVTKAKANKPMFIHDCNLDNDVKLTNITII